MHGRTPKWYKTFVDSNASQEMTITRVEGQKIRKRVKTDGCQPDQDPCRRAIDCSENEKQRIINQTEYKKTFFQQYSQLVTFTINATKTARARRARVRRSNPLSRITRPTLKSRRRLRANPRNVSDSVLLEVA